MELAEMLFGFGLGYILLVAVVIAWVAHRSARIESGDIPVKINEDNTYDFGG